MIFRWLAHHDEWQGRPAHAFVEARERSLCKRASWPQTPVQVRADSRSAALCKVCSAMLENALDMQEARP